MDPLVAKRLAAVAAHVSDHTSWLVAEDLHSTVVLLCTLLADLEDAQAPFKLVDSAMSFEAKAERLINWTRSHPQTIINGAAKIVSDLPSNLGERGIILGSDLSAGEVALSIPADVACSTETADKSHELGPLLDVELPLRSIPPSLLAMHLLVEHSKALHAAAAGQDGSWSPSIPSAATQHTRTTEQVFADKQKARNAAKMQKEERPAITTQLAVDGRPGSHPWGSKWRAYMSLLPSAVPCCLSWSPLDWAVLHGTPVFEEAAMHLRNVAKMYTQLHEHFVQRNLIDGFAPFYTWAGFKWALSMVMSRQNAMPGTIGGTNLALIPVFDMVNHASEAAGLSAGATMTSTGPGGHAIITSEIKAWKQFAAGEQLTHSYGYRPASELLMFQGFCSPEACGPGRDHGTRISLVMNPMTGEDPLFKIRANVLKAVSISPQKNSKMTCAAMVQGLRAKSVEYALRKAAEKLGFATHVEDLAALPKEKQLAVQQSAQSFLQGWESMSSAQLVERMVDDNVKWKWPMTFEVPCEIDEEYLAARHAASRAAATSGKAAPPELALGPDPQLQTCRELLSFCRAAMMDKTDAAVILRLVQAHKEKEKAALAAANGHSHGGGELCTHSCHGGPQQEVDIGPMTLPPLRPETEAKARALAEEFILHGLAKLRKGDARVAGAAGGVLPHVFLRMYKDSHEAMLMKGLEIVRQGTE